LDTHVPRLGHSSFKKKKKGITRWKEEEEEEGSERKI